MHEKGEKNQTLSLLLKAVGLETGFNQFPPLVLSHILYTESGKINYR